MHSVEIDRARGFIYNLLSLLFVEEYAKNNSLEIKNGLKLLQITLLMKVLVLLVMKFWII